MAPQEKEKSHCNSLFSVLPLTLLLLLPIPGNPDKPRACFFLPKIPIAKTLKSLLNKVWGTWRKTKAQLIMQIIPQPSCLVLIQRAELSMISLALFLGLIFPFKSCQQFYSSLSFPGILDLVIKVGNLTSKVTIFFFFLNKANSGILRL